MDISQQKQAFSIAYVRAVAAKAGFKVYFYDVDDDSVDLGLSGGVNLARRPHLEVQLKCSADDELRDDDFSFTLKAKNYNDLRADTDVARILVVVRVPPELDDWIDCDEQRLLIRRCGYWRSMRGEPNKDSDTMTVRMPRAQRLDADQLTSIMGRVQSGGRP